MADVTDALGGDAHGAPGALTGITVLDFTRFQQGTCATMLLGDLGAEIIKVEQPTGDPGRGLGAGYFEFLNRNKRSICLDLRKPEAVAVVRRLASRADIVTENFRPGTMDRLGVGYEVLSRDNPGLIYASGNMFGPRGPRSADPGYDAIAQAAGGLAMAHRLEGDDTPHPIQPGIADQAGGFAFVYAILAALVNKLLTSRGQRVDSSLLGALVTLQGIHLARGWNVFPSRPAGQSSTAPLSFRALCSDGRWICFGFLEITMWPNLARGIGLGHLVEDPRFATGEARARNQVELLDIVNATVIHRPSHEWLDQLRKFDCPCTLVNDFDTLGEDEQVQANGYLVEYEHPAYGPLRMPGPPAVFAATPAKVWRRAPIHPGEHSREILTEAGYAPEELESLLESGAVRAGKRDEVAAQGAAERA